MKLTATLVTAALVGAVILGVLAWAPTAEAWEPICTRCKNIPFSGNQCVEAEGSGFTNCWESGSGACFAYGGSCNGLTHIER